MSKVATLYDGLRVVVVQSKPFPIEKLTIAYIFNQYGELAVPTYPNKLYYQSYDKGEKLVVQTYIKVYLLMVVVGL